MDDNFETKESDCECPECGGELRLNLKNQRTRRTNIQVYCKYFFDCAAHNECTYSSQIYTGPSVKADSFNDNEQLIEAAQEKAVKSAKNKVRHIEKNLASA